MAITVTNQKPAVLDPVHLITCRGAYDPIKALETAITDPIRTPLNPAAPAVITGAGGADLSGDITRMLLACLGQYADPAAEHEMKDLLAQTLVDFDARTFLPVSELYAVQAGHARKLPPPGPNVIYTAGADVIPAAKGLLAGSMDERHFFATLAYTYHPDTLGFWFQTSAVFEDFKVWLSGQTQAITGVLPAETVKLLGDFMSLSLAGLTESLLLRAHDGDQNHEFSFARVILHQLMSFAQARPTTGVADVGVLPFTVGELFCPRSIVLVNAEAHARATPATVTAEWKLINSSLASPVKVISASALSRLTALPRQAARAAAQAHQLQLANIPSGRSARVRFRARPPRRIELAAALRRVLARMDKVARSQNLQRQPRISFARPSRRNPDDFNRPGRSTTSVYRPDIHVYIDTSGSISEDNYRESVQMLIHIAKRLNVNLYFNSFSDSLSTEVMLRVKDRSLRQIWNEFRRIPKVTGGTEYQQVWNYINASAARRRRLSLMITDFEWSPPATRQDHPPNLYYAPCSAMDWQHLTDLARKFTARMRHIEPGIAQRLLGMIV